MADFRFSILLRSCEGYGLQCGSSLVRVLDESMSVYIESPIAFLLKKDGSIACTIMTDQEKYESEENRDRRYLNNKNGFQLEWNDEKRICEVFYTSKHTSLFIATYLASHIDGALQNINRFFEAIRSFFYYIAVFLKKKSSREEISYTKTYNFNSRSFFNDVQLNKERLQSTSCTMDTLKDVSTWWAKLNDKEVELINQSYRFKEAIAMYRLFFLARKVDDMKTLLIHKNVFSKRQIEVIRAYSKNKDRFSSWRREMGMSFSKPYELQYIS